MVLPLLSCTLAFCLTLLRVAPGVVGLSVARHAVASNETEGKNRAGAFMVISGMSSPEELCLTVENGMVDVEGAEVIARAIDLDEGIFVEGEVKGRFGIA